MRAILGSMLLLTGCGGASDEPRQSTSEPPSAFQSAFAQLAEPERNIALIRAIRDAGRECQGVIGSERQGVGTRGDPLYVARCTGGASYGVLIGRDGTAHVVGAPQP